MTYFWIKLIHIISSTLFFGTGLGTAFYFWKADRTKNVQIIAFVSKQVVTADSFFTIPSAVIQPLSGVFLLKQLELPLSTPWIAISFLLYCIVGALWLPAFWVQLKITKSSSKAALLGDKIDYPHEKYMLIWYTLGTIAFPLVIVIFYLMTFKPSF